MSEPKSVTLWLNDLKAGNVDAADRLWQRYYESLVRLAARKLRHGSRRVADEEDVVVTAFASFFRGVAEGRFPRLDDRDDLWQVLVMITARKAANLIKHNQRLKRGADQVRGDSVWNGGFESRAAFECVIDNQPTPEFAHEVGEELERLLGALPDEVLKRVALAKMEGFTNDEIAGQLGVKTRTVERKLNLIRACWLEGAGDESPL